MKILTKHHVFILFFIFLNLFLYAGKSYSDYLSEIYCEDKVSDHEELEIEGFKDTLLKVALYKRAKDSIKIGDLKFDIINYIFEENRYIGKSIPVVKKDVINQLLETLDKEHKLIEKQDDKRELLWITKEGEFVVFKRYSMQLENCLSTAIIITRKRESARGRLFFEGKRNVNGVKLWPVL